MFKDDFDIMLYVRDVGRSIDFYHGVLGFDFQGWWSKERSAFVKEWDSAGRPGYAELSAGPLKITLHASDGEVAGDACMFHLRVSDIDAYQSTVAAKGGDISEARNEPWGWRMSVLKDPDGHEWGFYTPIEND